MLLHSSLTRCLEGSVLLLAATALNLLAPLAFPQSADAATGVLDLNAWCARHNPENSVSASAGPPPRPARRTTAGRASVKQPNAYGWACVSDVWVQNMLTGQWKDVDNNLYRSPVDMQNACKEAYGTPAVAHYTNWNDPYSWYCIY